MQEKKKSPFPRVSKIRLKMVRQSLLMAIFFLNLTPGLEGQVTDYPIRGIFGRTDEFGETKNTVPTLNYALAIYCFQDRKLILKYTYN